jgi:hypothetical protein
LDSTGRRWQRPPLQKSWFLWVLVVVQPLVADAAAQVSGLPAPDNAVQR